MNSVKMPLSVFHLFASKGVTNLCCLGFSLMLLASVSSAGTPNRVLTYFSDKRIPWNDAAELCRSRGTRLLTTDSEDVRLALEYFSHNSWSSYWTTNFWTGLHRVPGEYLYTWHTSCKPLGTYTPWRWSGAIADKKCVAGHPDLEEDAFWVLRLCENGVAIAICEQQTGQCTFMERPDTEVQGIKPDYPFDAPSLADCQQACLSDNLQPECWAVVYYVGSCYFFRAHSMAELIDNSDDNAANGRTSLYVKFCFEAQLDHTGLVVSFNDPIHDNEPWAGCSESVSERTPDLSTEMPGGKSSTISSTSASLKETTAIKTTSVPSSETTATKTTSAPSSETTATKTTSAPSSETTPTKTTFAPSSETTPTKATSKSVNSSRNTTHEGTTFPYDRTTASYEMTTASYDGTTSPYDKATTSDTIKITYRSSEDGKGVTDLLGPGTDGGTYTETFMSLSESSDKIVTLRTTTVTPKEDQESTVSVFTTRGVDSTGEGMEEWCECHCNRFVKLSQAEKKEFTEKLISSLNVNKSDISSNRRRYESAHDPRPSAQRVGWLGLVLLCITFGGLFLTDFHKLYRDITCKTARKY